MLTHRCRIVNVRGGKGRRRPQASAQAARGVEERPRLGDSHRVRTAGRYKIPPDLTLIPLNSIFNCSALGDDRKAAAWVM